MISFVIPAYNEELYLPKCLDSILSQTKKMNLVQGRDFEIVVVNNASTDKTAEIAESYPGVILVNEQRKGLSYARQAGFEKAKGDLIANLDADTTLTDGWINFVLNEFSKNPDLAALSGPHVFSELSNLENSAIKIFYSFGMIAYFFNKFIFKIGSMIQGGNFVVRKKALQKIGGFNTDFVFYGEDTDIAKRLYKVGDVRFTFKMPIWASARRIQKEGKIKTAFKYSINYLSTTAFGKPVTKNFSDIRPNAKK